MIHHVTLQIAPSHLRDCIAFYAILGFDEVEPPAGIAGRAVWLERHVDAGAALPSQQVHLMPEPGASAPPGHFALVCPEYEATLQALRAAGHEVEPRRQHWGSPRSYVHDPAGNLVELMERPPGGGG
jgi:catechol 2,3-dioxygenase-like lactoylglutathione lyase family enzyme